MGSILSTESDERPFAFHTLIGEFSRAFSSQDAVHVRSDAGNWSDAQSIARPAGLWWPEHDALLEHVRRRPLCAQCGDVTVHASEDERETAVRVARLCAAVSHVYRLGRIRIFLLLSDAKRVFPPRGERIGRNHLNGGACVRGAPNTVLIVRREELLKVVVHECLHICLPNTWPEANIPSLRAALGASPASALAPFEAWVELWAEVTCVAVVGALSSENALHCDAIWSEEMAWGRAQARRVWLRDDAARTGTLVEDTWALEYFVLRAAMMDATLTQLALMRPWRTADFDNVTDAMRARVSAFINTFRNEPEEMCEGETLRMTRNLPELVENALTLQSRVLAAAAASTPP